MYIWLLLVKVSGRRTHGMGMGEGEAVSSNKGQATKIDKNVMELKMIWSLAGKHSNWQTPMYINCIYYFMLTMQ